MSNRTVNVSQALARSADVEQKRKYIPCCREVIWWDFVAQEDSCASLEELNSRTVPLRVGHEQKYRRMALVMTNRQHNEAGIALVIPITTTPKETKINKSETVLEIEDGVCKKVRGYLLINQAQPIDLTERRPEFVERAPLSLVQEAHRLLSQLTLPK